MKKSTNDARATGELSEEQLAKVAGGNTSVTKGAAGAANKPKAGASSTTASGLFEVEDYSFDIEQVL